ncbi:MAG TPA: SO2930 family diheme c-type cytochrome [Chryseosolibacter sp.]|nr:SO2930 family diheme c-type cytochrome [Chryseosolibacter sp.]
MRLFVVLTSLLAFALCSFHLRDNARSTPKETLSEYGFFKGKLSDLNPVETVLPYSVNTPLFSNYAEKARFVQIPTGSKVTYNDTASLDFPVGTFLIKNFYYPHDFRKPEKGRRIIETRVLLRDESGWQAYPYIWNEEQTEAYYDPAGETIEVKFINASGKKITTPYVIPNKNQCKGCHHSNDTFTPIGTSARQLNGDMTYADVGRRNQLIYWQEIGVLNIIPETLPRLAVWNDENTGNINERARAYLDANCGHCHSRTGPANTSGLFLNIFENDPGHLGVHKAPVAAGRGAGDLQYDIVPGDPQKSILVYRMNTTDPAIAMPEIGRELIHIEGIELIEEWIRKNTFVSN